MDAGVLTREEFEAEKAYLLKNKVSRDDLEERAPKRRLVTYIALASILSILVGASITYVYSSFVGSDEAAIPDFRSARNRENAAPTVSDVSITFADTSKCEPGPGLADLLSQVKVAGAAEDGSDLRLMHLTGVSSPVEVDSAIRNFGQQQVRLARLPISATWMGHRITEVRTMEWDEGSGFQLRFESPPENLLRTLKQETFPIEAEDVPSTVEGVFVGIEKSGRGAILNCMKSKQSGQAADDLERTDTTRN